MKKSIVIAAMLLLIAILLTSCRSEKSKDEKVNVAQFEVGNTVTMGNYGGEAIEWLVLAAEGDNRTMIAVKGQDAVCFNESESDGNKWETSYIRGWLNDTFYNAAFSAEEKAKIVPGVTNDNVWLLSVEEVEKYFANDDARICYPTDAAKKNDAFTKSNGAGFWWLRSSGSTPFTATCVIGIGSVNTYGDYICRSRYMARPVVVVSVGH